MSTSGEGPGGRRLVVVSHTVHHERDGRVVGWGPTVREIDHLARQFEHVVHVAPLHPGTASDGEREYEADHIRLRPVEPLGGSRLRDKLGVFLHMPRYWSVIRSEIRSADVVHVRCPANIGLAAILLLLVTRRGATRWVKYAGRWASYSGEPLTYAIQRWMLARKVTGAIVTVTGESNRTAAHIHAVPNPCLSEDEIGAARVLAEEKDISEPVRLLFVGRLTADKGIHHLPSILARVRTRCDATLDVVGGGPEETNLLAAVRAKGLEPNTSLHGYLSRDELAGRYLRAHLLLLPSRTEGWPKVLGEAMAYGTVPIASSVGSIPEYVARIGAGMVCHPDDPESFADAVLDYVAQPKRWRRERLNALNGADTFTYSRYVQNVMSILGLEPASQGAVESFVMR